MRAGLTALSLLALLWAAPVSAVWDRLPGDSKKRIADLDGTSALLFQRILAQGDGVYDAAVVRLTEGGITTEIVLPASEYMLNNPSGLRADYVLRTPRELWAFIGSSLNHDLRLVRYAVLGEPPTSATLTGTYAVGDGANAKGALRRLASGAIVAAWFRADSCGAGCQASLRVGLSYVSPAGVYTELGPYLVGPPLTSGLSVVAAVNITIAQHPVTGQVWAFYKPDAWAEIISIRLSEVSAGLHIDAIDREFLSQRRDGSNGPDGELPWMNAVPDPARQAILLMYHRNVFRIFSSNPFHKGAQLGVVSIRGDGAKVFSAPVEAWAERVTQFGTSVAPDGTITVAYFPDDPTNPQREFPSHDLTVQTFAGGAWSPPSVAGFSAWPFGVGYHEQSPGWVIQCDPMTLCAIAGPPPPPANPAPRVPTNLVVR